MRISAEVGMPITRQPAFCKYANGVDKVQPMFQHIMQIVPDCQFIMCILPGKMLIYRKCRQSDSFLDINTLQRK